MKHWKLAGSTAMMTILAGTGAFAQVTPEEVWQNWQDMTSAYGQSVTAGSVAREGDTLVVSAVVIAYDKDGVVVNGTIEKMNFADKGDGTVAITMSDTYPIDVKMPATAGVEGAKPSDLAVTISQPGIVITASGTAAATNYEFNGPSIGIKVESKDAADPTVVNGTFDATMTDTTAKYLVFGDTSAKKITSEFAAKSMTMTFAGADKTIGSDFAFNATVADIAGNSNGNFLDAEAMVDIAAALKAGFAVDGGFTHGPVTFDLNVNEPEAKTTKIAGTMASGGITVLLDATKLLYGGGNKGVAFTLSSSNIPVPEVKVGYAESAFNLLMPVAKSDAPSDFAFLTKLVDFSVSDDIWAMVDPAGALPHDPATIIIDTKGTARLTADIMDKTAMDALGDAPPGELNSLDVTELKATVAGAELTGAGSFTFDNTDKTTFGGMPAPTGKMDLKVVGANTLMDKLVTMGLLSQDDVMGARMMVSMFANTATDKDEMTSTLEFKDKGFFANGQQLQ